METDPWLTKAEQTSFQETSRYPETMDYCRRLQQASPWIQFTSFGRSPEGRDLPLLIVSKEQCFTPAIARQSGCTILLIINGIHSGEIAGKEASLMLLRDIAIRKQNHSLLDRNIVLMVPIYNVDGHERFSPYNRINQNGPKEMGFRATAQNLNLNRDWIKAEQPETKAMLKLFAEWLPDLVIDNHVSDGADFQYDVTWLSDDHCALATPVREYFQRDLEPHLIESLTRSGHVVARYFELRNPHDPSQGLLAGPFQARYSNGYCTLQNRPCFVVETHMIKSFEARIRAHYDLMQTILQKTGRDAELLRNVVENADQQTMMLPKNDYPIRLKLSAEISHPMTYKGIEYRKEASSISGSTKIVFGTAPIDISVRFFNTSEPEKTIDPPLGYIVPVQWSFVSEKLEAHSIPYSRLEKSITGQFETYRFSNVTWAASPFEGRRRVRFASTKITEECTLRAGSILVLLNQRVNRVILELLEPEAADSLVSWGFFDAIFEEKESPEDYVLEKLAEEMLQSNEGLAREFEQRLATDAAFRSDPAARLNFFYERSPFRDPRKNIYPIVRITDPSQISSL